MVHQHFKLVETQTVAENVILGLKEPAFRLDMKRTAQELLELGARYKMTVDPNAYIWQLSVGEQQRVENPQDALPPQRRYPDPGRTHRRARRRRNWMIWATRCDR